MHCTDTSVIDVYIVNCMRFNNIVRGYDYLSLVHSSAVVRKNLGKINMCKKKRKEKDGSIVRLWKLQKKNIQLVRACAATQSAKR